MLKFQLELYLKHLVIKMNLEKIKSTKVEDMNSLLILLEENGFKIYSSTPYVPTQIEGWLPTGEPFYYRARGTCATLRVWSKEEKPFDNNFPNEKYFNPLFYGIKEEWEWPEAGCLEIEETKNLLIEFIEEFKEKK